MGYPREKIDNIYKEVTVSSIKTGNYVVQLNDYVIRTDTSGGEITITLPASHTQGRIYIIKDVAGSCSSFPVTVVSADSDTIDGEADALLAVNYGAIYVVSDGTNWVRT